MYREVSHGRIKLLLSFCFLSSTHRGGDDVTISHKINSEKPMVTNVVQLYAQLPAAIGQYHVGNVTFC